MARLVVSLLLALPLVALAQWTAGTQLVEVDDDAGQFLAWIRFGYVDDFIAMSATKQNLAVCQANLATATAPIVSLQKKLADAQGRGTWLMGQLCTITARTTAYYNSLPFGTIPKQQWDDVQWLAWACGNHWSEWQ